MSVLIENNQPGPVILYYKDAQALHGLRTKPILGGDVSNHAIRENNTLTDAQWSLIHEHASNGVFFRGDKPRLVVRGAKCRWLDESPAAGSANPEPDPSEDPESGDDETEAQATGRGRRGRKAA